MSLIKPYRHGFQKGFNSYKGTNEKTGIEFDILITDKDEEHEFGEKENEIAIVAIDGVGEIFLITQLYLLIDLIGLILTLP